MTMGRHAVTLTDTTAVAVAAAIGVMTPVSWTPGISNFGTLSVNFPLP